VATKLAPLVLCTAFAALAASPAEAHTRKSAPNRRGAQAEVVFGASACIPGQGDCRDDTDMSGRTAPLVGLGLNLGWRASRNFFVGGGYSVGWFQPEYEIQGDRVYARAYQNSLFVVLRAIIPLWRFDFGAELSPGWSRQVFVLDAGNDDAIYSQGFALRPGLSADLWLSRHLFVGAKIDTILNFHSSACLRTKGGFSCEIKSDNRQARVNQLIAGIHLGGTF